MDRPHFAYPFQRGANNRVNVVEQDSIEHVDTQANIVVRCPTGFRVDKPEFGWPFPEFHNVPIDTAALQAAITRWVGAHVTADEYAEAADQAMRRIDVEVQG
jgi:phage baseplate assembly protein W